MRLAILILLPVLAWAQSSPPKVEPKEQSTPKKEEAAANNQASAKPISKVGIESPPAEQPKSKDDGKNGSVWRDLFTTVDGFTFWVLVIQSVFLVWTIRVMVRSDERQLRPYVSFSFIKTPWPTEAGVISFEFICINHGQSPAKDVRFRADAWCVDSPPIDGRTLSRLGDYWNEDRMNLFPNDEERQKTWIIPCTLGKPLTPAETQEIVSLKRYLVLGLEVGYTDMFEKKHVTGSYYLIGPGGRVSLIPKSSTLT